MTDDKQSPFEVGFAAAFDWCSERKPHAPCPYPEGSAEHQQYSEGYDEGIAMYEVM